MPDSTIFLNREAIMSRVPHQGDNCLLDSVSHWDQQHITCESKSHLLTTNPYRIDGRLPAVCAVEFAAQSFALHASLKDEAAGANHLRRHGYLASVSNLALLVSSLDECAGRLQINAEELYAQQDGLLYSFSLNCQNALIARGRATIAFIREAQ